MDVDPGNANTLYVAYQAPATGSSLPDAWFSRSTDGGDTWSSPVAIGTGPNDQFRPSITSGPEGAVSMFWYDRRNDPSNTLIDVYGRFSADRGLHWGPVERVTSTNFDPGELNPNWDTSRRNCEWEGKIDSTFPGSGAYVIWGDGRDAGPAANHGVNPNIYFAHVPIPTVVSTAVARGTTVLTVTGAVVPKVAGGRVTTTLYRKVGTSYVKVTAKTAILDAAGKYRLTFNRPAAGSCKEISKFLGNAEYLASTVTKTFLC